MADLNGVVALVAGASRGVGRGVAEGLGEAAATVYVTARSGGGAEPTEGRSETVEETAEIVERLGGEGIAVRCDHTVEAEVEAVFDRVRDERGRLDVLVNNVWGGYEGYDLAEWGLPFWEVPWSTWERMRATALDAKLRTARAAAPLLIGSGRGLLVNVSSPVADEYHPTLPYWVVNHAVDRMSEAMAAELADRGTTALSLQPGFTRTERVMEAYADEPEKREADRIDEVTHYPRYVGRAVAALAADPDVSERAGKAWSVGILATEYGFTDVDGRRPQWPPPE